MSARPLSILLVLGDRAALRHGSRLLSVFGYEVHCQVSTERARMALLAEQADIVITDTTGGLDDALNLVRSVVNDRSARFVYTLLLTGELAPGEAVLAFEAGVDDFLAAPLEHGELLARLRTAARVLEYERRLENRDRQNPTHGPLDRAGFLSRLTTELTVNRQKHHPTSCVAIKVDQSTALQRLSSRRVARTALEQITSTLRAATIVEHSLAQLSEHLFAIIVRGGAENSLTPASLLRAGIAEANIRVDESLAAVTISCGVATANAAIGAAELLEQAEQCVRQARQSGGDCTIVAGELAGEDQQWSDLATAGKLFESTLARDIMVPCTVVLDRGDSISLAAQLLEQTQLRALPVIDDEGKLTGLLNANSILLHLAADDCAREPVSGIMSTEVVSFDEQTTLAALIDYFTQESPLVIVIVNKGRPTGLVTPSSLATLSEQISTETFADEHAAASRGRAQLIVPNLCGVDVE